MAPKMWLLSHKTSIQKFYSCNFTELSTLFCWASHSALKKKKPWGGIQQKNSHNLNSDVLQWEFISLCNTEKHALHPISFKSQNDEWSSQDIWVLLLFFFWTETGFLAPWHEPALIFTTSSHSSGSCQQSRQAVSRSYAATVGPIPLLQLCCWHDSWWALCLDLGSPSYFCELTAEEHFSETPRRRWPRSAWTVCLREVKQKVKKRELTLEKLDSKHYSHTHTLHTCKHREQTLRILLILSNQLNVKC